MTGGTKAKAKTKDYLTAESPPLPPLLKIRQCWGRLDQKVGLWKGILRHSSRTWAGPWLATGHSSASPSLSASDQTEVYWRWPEIRHRGLPMDENSRWISTRFRVHLERRKNKKGKFHAKHVKKYGQDSPERPVSSTTSLTSRSTVLSSLGSDYHH